MKTPLLMSPPVPASVQNNHTWQNLYGSSLALALANLVEQSEQMILLIAETAHDALQLQSELQTFLKHTDLPVQYFPNWETLPYDTFSPHQGIVSERLRLLAQLPHLDKGVLIVTLNTALQVLPPVSFVASHSLQLKINQVIELDALREQLIFAGYQAVHQVFEHGEFSLRGSILDIYPMGSKVPFRLEFFDNEIERIQEIDSDTQLSIRDIERIDLLPAREFPTNQEAITLFRQNFRETLGTVTASESMYQQVSKGIFPSGIEFYFPLFFKETAHLFDFLSDEALVITQGAIQSRLDKLWADINFRYEDRRWDINQPILEPSRLYLSKELFNQLLKSKKRIRVDIDKLEAIRGPQVFQTDILPELLINARLKDPYEALRKALQATQASQTPVLFIVPSAGRREALYGILQQLTIHAKEYNSFSEFIEQPSLFGVLVGQINHSFLAQQVIPSRYVAGHPDFSLHQQLNTALDTWVITETELLGSKPEIRQSHRHIQNPDALVKNLTELTLGKPVVHIQYGVGRYQGLTSLDIGDVTNEYLTLEYAGDAKLFVPVNNLHMISRYSGADPDTVALNSLSSNKWTRTRAKAAEKIRDVAAELLDVYAQRQAKPGFAFQIQNDEEKRFAAGFAFTETDDQLQAITAVQHDMAMPKAMDRLVCGDVGFGKTEVAMRAAFTAVNNNKQVAVLVPTTLLAQQHYETFKDRFADWPIQVEVLSRFRSGKQTQDVLDRLKEGKVDIIIGTHKLLQNDVDFSDLGLLIVDEEHRFGVKQKERIKNLRAEVDILTLTATPIPRTLNMAMNNVRDLSIIATPPARRLAVRTFVHEYQDATIREAILREVLRGGQVYFLHNQVDSIQAAAEKLQQLVPEATIQVAHGQMGERMLESIMTDFYHRRFHVLVCTTIIETGIDIPTANTIIIERADKFGLAQLHQLRGRVGRSHHQAYAYLLTPHPKLMTKDAHKRLEALSQLEDLGAGFVLATHDLEIRGAGELLGSEQSGQIEGIGFSLYMDMLEQAVTALQEGKEPSLDDLIQSQTEVDLKAACLFPDDYIADIHTRLSMYKRVASATNKNELDQLQVELIDRFGLLPAPAKNLFITHQVKLQANTLGIQKIDLAAQGGFIDFKPNPPINTEGLIRLLMSNPNNSMVGTSRIKIVQECASFEDRVKFIWAIIEQLRIEPAKESA